MISRRANRPLKLRAWQYEELLRQQGGGCAICKLRPDPGRRLAVDHCHETGTVRGLLCNRCNLGVAFLEDSVVRFRAVKYVERARSYVSYIKEGNATDAKCYKLRDFLRRKFRNVDWRRCNEPDDREALLRWEVERLRFEKRLTVAQTAEALKITPARVRQVSEGEPRHYGRVYYRPIEILWPEGQPPRTRIRELRDASGSHMHRPRSNKLDLAVTTHAPVKPRTSKIHQFRDAIPEEWTLTDVAAAWGVHKSNASRRVATLLREGIAERTDRSKPGRRGQMARYRFAKPPSSNQ